ncbi:MAG: BrnA antitoxin family protein [Burkholderiales bacterium]
MPTVKKPKTTSRRFSAAKVAAAKARATGSASDKPEVDWSKGVVTLGGGVAATVHALRRTRGPSKRPTKEQVAIRLDQEVVGAFRSGGPGWQTRINAALKEWLSTRSVKRRARGHSAV